MSFLGAGVIFKHGNAIRGLTTAAGLWATAGIGLAVGSGMYLIGVLATAIIALVQVLMHRYTLGAGPAAVSRLQVSLHGAADFGKKFSAYASAHKITVLKSEINRQGGEVSFDILLRADHFITLEQIADFLDADSDIKNISCTPVF